MTVVDHPPADAAVAEAIAPDEADLTVADRARRTVAGVAAAVRGWRRRRSAQGKRNKAAMGLLALLVVELGAFAWALSTVFAAPTPGHKIGLDELTALAKQRRVTSATLLDADNRLIGRFTAGVITVDTITQGLPSTSPAVEGTEEGSYYVDIPSSGPLTAEIYRTLSAAQASVNEVRGHGCRPAQGAAAVRSPRVRQDAARQGRRG